MPQLEILGTKIQIKPRFFFSSMNAHDNIIQGSQRLQWKTSPQSQQPTNLRTPQPIETHKRSHNDHAQDEGSKKPPLINETPCRKIDAES